jgi:hypothetical protein
VTQARRLGALRCAVALLVLATPTSTVAQASPAPATDQAVDDAAGWGAPERSADPDDAAGWPSDGQSGDSEAPEDDAAGWGEAPPEGATAEPPADEARPYALVGFARWDGALAIERLRQDPFAKARFALDVDFRWSRGPVRVVAGIHGEVDLVHVGPWSTSDAATRSRYGYWVRPRELYASVHHGAVEAVLGWQVLALGVADMLSVLDVAAPLDQREPGLADVEDLRVSTLGSRLGVYHGALRVEVLLTHEAGFGRRAPPLGRLSPLRAFVYDHPSVSGTSLEALVDRADVRYRNQPDRFGPAQQVYARALYQGSRAEVGAYFFSLLDPIGFVRTPSPLGLLAPELVLDLEHRRFHAVGASLLVPAGDFVLFAETRADIARPVTLADTAAILPRTELDRRDVVSATLGGRFHGLPGVVLAAEFSMGSDGQRRAPEGQAPLLFPVNPPTVALRYEHLFLRERLRWATLFVASGPRLGSGFLVRSEVSYDLRHGLRGTLAYVHYHPGNEPGPIYGFRRNDRIWLALRWDFSVW